MSVPPQYRSFQRIYTRRTCLSLSSSRCSSSLHCERRFMGLMNAGYCDESESTQNPPVYVVSGYLANGPHWFDLARKWRAALAEEGLSSFHMAPCEAAAKNSPYEHMTREHRD